MIAQAAPLAGMAPQTAITFGLIAGLIAILYGIYLISWVLKQPAGNATMQAIAGAIQEGAMAFLRRQYTTVAIVAVVLFIVIFFFRGQYFVDIGVCLIAAV